MADRKQDVLDMLRELAELTVLDEADPQSFRVRAYESAAHGVDAFGGDIEALDAKELQKIEGVGKSTAAKIRELIETGRVQKLEALRQKHPAKVVALLQIQGLGPKAIRRLRDELGVQSIEDLRAALQAHRLRELKGFGVASEDKLARTLQRLEQQGAASRTPISVALPLAERIAAQLAQVPGVSHASYCGSLRRFCELIGDIDLVVAAEDPERVMEAVATLSVAERTLARGGRKISVVTRRGIQIDVRVVERSQLGAAQLYFTGSKAHNIKLRQRALQRGLILNEYALAQSEDDKVIASDSEEAIYAALGLAFIPPWLREDAGEIEAAERGALPRALGKVLGDFHLHSSLSGDARTPLAQMVQSARARGYRALAVTDHAEGTLSGVGRAALLEQRAQLKALAAELGPDFALLHGVELNIGPHGELDYDADFRRGFDFCLASVHDHFDLDKAAQTRRVIRAMEDPCVRMIGHLSARMIGARPGIDLDLDAIFAAAERTRTALEINGSLPRLDLSVEALRRVRGRPVDLVLTSDAHRHEELERILHALRNAERAGIEPAQVVNADGAERLLQWLRTPKPATAA
jgi:DNA polymerase (family 10)